MALPKKLRLKSKSEISELFRKGEKRKTPFFFLLFNKEPNQGLKIAILTSKKIDKKASKRNLLKRKFSQAIRQIIEKEKINPAKIIFLPKKEALVKKQTEIKLEIKKVLRKEGIISISNDKKSPA